MAQYVPISCHLVLLHVQSVTIRDPKRNPTYTASAARTSKTLIDTNTVADKILGVISGILQVGILSRINMIAQQHSIPDCCSDMSWYC